MQLGKHDESVLADDFRFEFPIIKLDKKVSLSCLEHYGMGLSYSCCRSPHHLCALRQQYYPTVHEAPFVTIIWKLMRAPFGCRAT